jgi:HAD superfamily hydrolase (TIGR01509 family)
MSSKLIIFDCDGVLVDSEIIGNRLDAVALSTLGYPITTEECIRKFTGMSAKAACQVIKTESGIDIPFNFFELQHPLLFKTFETELIPLMDPVLSILEELNVNRCVASNSARDRVIRCLDLTNQLSYFSDQSIFSSQQVAKSKPAPDLFLFAANQMGYSPADCIVLEDSPAGVEAALAANMTVIGFLGGEHTAYEWYKERLQAYNIPIVSNAYELLQLLPDLLNGTPLLAR